MPPRPAATDNPSDTPSDVPAIAWRRLRMALLLTGVLLTIDTVFILLAAFGKRLLAVQLTGGLTLALVLAVAVILSALVLAVIYVVWANRCHDPAVAELGRGRVL